MLLPPEVRSSPEVKVTSKVPLRLLARLDSLCNSLFFRAIPRFQVPFNRLSRPVDFLRPPGHNHTYFLPVYNEYKVLHQLYYLM